MADAVPVPLVSLFTEVEDPRRPQARLHALEDTLHDCSSGCHLRRRQLNRGRTLRVPEAGLAGNVPGVAARHPFAQHLRARRCAAGPRPTGGLLYALSTIAGGDPRELGRVGGRQCGPPFPRHPLRGVPLLHLVSVWTNEARLVLGRCRVDDQSNEITAIPALLKMLVLEGGIVTIDAMGCQKRIAQTLRDREVDYVLVLKDNQPQLNQAVVETLAVEPAEAFEDCNHDFHKAVNKGHGRTETRRCWVLGTSEYNRCVDPDGTWPGLHSLVIIEAQRRQGSDVTSETRYYISSLPPDAQNLLWAVRSHWGVECPALGLGHGLPRQREPHSHWPRCPRPTPPPCSLAPARPLRPESRPTDRRSRRRSPARRQRSLGYQFSQYPGPAATSPLIKRINC